MEIFGKLINYIKETRIEVKHVNWPSRKTTIRFTFLVIGISAAIAFFLGGLDILFSFLIRVFLQARLPF